MTTILYPYLTLAQPMEVALGPPRLNGESSHAVLVQPEERTLNLFEAHGGWQEASVPISITASPEVLDALEEEHGPTQLLVVAHCRPTNTRQSLLPVRCSTDRSRWEGTLELDRDNFCGRVELRTVLTATVDGVAHRPVAFGEPWVVHFDEPASLRTRGTLRVVWKDFKDPEAPPLARQFEDSTHVVSLAEAVPEIWLNSSFEGLEPLLRDRKDRRGIEKGLHDMQRMSIARSVWMALVGDALAAVRPGEDGESPQRPEAPWQQEILDRILPEVSPYKSETELLRAAADDWRTHPGSAEFLARAEAVIGDLIKANASLRRFVQSYRGEEER